METKKTAFFLRNFKVKKWALVTFVCCFLMAWSSMMTSGLTARGCVNDRYEGEKKLLFCNVSIISGTWLPISKRDRARSAMKYLNRGIAYSQLGREQEAAKEFQKAFHDAQAKPGPWSVELIERMEQEPNARARMLWSILLNED